MEDMKFGALPVGLGMAQMQNPEASACYQQLTPNKQMELVDGTHEIHSKEEMRRFVAAISKL